MSFVKMSSICSILILLCYDSVWAMEENRYSDVLAMIPAVIVEVTKDETSCCICLRDIDTVAMCARYVEEPEEEYPVVKLPCSHYYCQDCIRQWANKNPICPICADKIALGLLPRAPFCQVYKDRCRSMWCNPVCLPVVVASGIAVGFGIFYLVLNYSLSSSNA